MAAPARILVTGAADGRLDAGFGQAFGVMGIDILPSAIGMIH